MFFYRFFDAITLMHRCFRSRCSALFSRLAQGFDFACEGGKQFAEGFFKACQAFCFEFDVELCPVNARLADLLQQLRGLVDVAQQGFFGSAMVFVSSVGRRRNSVDGIAANQQFDVAHIRVSGVFGTGARPQQALHSGTFFGEIKPVVVADTLKVVTVCRLGIGNGRPTTQIGVFVGKQGIDFAVHAADKEAGDGTQQVNGLATGNAFFQTINVGFEGLAVAFRREEQGGVDVDAFGGQAADGIKTGQRRRHFDHQVFPRDTAVEI